jgi:hypothetical protein
MVLKPAPLHGKNLARVIRASLFAPTLFAFPRRGKDSTHRDGERAALQ